jgi:hypothetical protein
LTVASTGNITIIGSAATCTLGNGTSATNCSSSDKRLKDNISALDASSSLLPIERLKPVSFLWNQWMLQNGAPTTTQFGFIAQQVSPIFANLVSEDPNTHYLKLDYQGLFAPIVAAIQALSTELASIENAIAGFAAHFASDTLVANNELCVGSTCVTPAQFQAMAAAANQSSVAPSSSITSTPDSTSSPQAPVIAINGGNPATIQIGSTYTDLGATITGPHADLNLGIKTFVNRLFVSNIQLDTSAAATDTIDYVVTDQNGLTSTSTRTIIVVPATDPPTTASPALMSADAASTSAATTSTE